MKVLFVYRGYGKNAINPVVDAQIESLKRLKIEIIKYPLLKGGILNYIFFFIRLFKFVWLNNIDLIHAHYSYSAFISALTFKRTICSLMGSDILNQSKLIIQLTVFFSKYIWKLTIVKSKEMNKIISNAVVIPNGVNFEIFKPIDRNQAYKVTGFDPLKKNIIFVATDYLSKVKNYKLAKNAIDNLKRNDVYLHVISNKTQKELNYYYNAADLLLLTSLHEGSPNVIKEALACNCPVIATDVGDIKELIKNIQGCYITTFNIDNICEKINKVLENNSRVQSRNAIQHLDQKQIANKLISYYLRIIN